MKKNASIALAFMTLIMTTDNFAAKKRTVEETIRETAEQLRPRRVRVGRRNAVPNLQHGINPPHHGAPQNNRGQNNGQPIFRIDARL